MTDWKPKWAPNIDLRALTLSHVEGFLASRIDGQTSVPELALLTSLPVEQVKEVLERLVSEGALLPGPEAPPPPPEEPAELGTGVTHLALYREQFHQLSADARAARASNANGAILSALCFDPLPGVIRAVMDNPHAGLEQARLIAMHHHNTTGLEFLFGKPELMRDGQVQRLLWRNPQLNEGQLRRLMQTKRLLEVWKLSVSREATSQTRTNTARLLRTRFATAPAEERVELIFSTEGRALAGLSGLAIDGKTTALLCARSYGSMLLVQNLAHWSATPPALISHLLRQPMVIRQPRLRTMLAHHPNAPADAKK
ncbi:MAG: hypothetical protein Q8N23_05625 [Archangium sp.]|nr:hypothetical protein [Archangium sp.]MDP3152128.1 hypothetical protein [Archangium sp.]MDP3574990.1 hypothetical protein [Archangium sp.]